MVSFYVLVEQDRGTFLGGSSAFSELYSGVRTHDPLQDVTSSLGRTTRDHQENNANGQQQNNDHKRNHGEFSISYNYSSHTFIGEVLVFETEF